MSISSPSNTPYLKLLAEFVIGPTSDNSTLGQSTDVFTAYLDDGFKGLGIDSPNNPTPRQICLVYETKRKGSYVDLFGSLEIDLDLLCWDQRQIRLLCQQRLRHFFVGRGLRNFLLFKADGKLNVARVYVTNDEKPGAFLHCFPDDYLQERFSRLMIPAQVVGN